MSTYTDEQCYTILNLSPGATAQQVKAAFRRLALQFHPDKNPTPEAAEKFRIIFAAHKQLLERLSAYDDNWARHFNWDYFESCSKKDNEKKPKDLPTEHEIWCSLEELLNGTTRRMPIFRTDIDENGKQTTHVVELDVIVEPGMEEGYRIRFEGQGDRNPHTLPGDVIFTIREKPHALFKRIKNIERLNIDLLYKTHPMPISYLELPSYLVNIPTLDGIDLSRPISDFEELQLRIPNRGMRYIPPKFFKDEIRRGDLVVKLQLAEEKSPIVPEIPLLLSHEELFAGTTKNVPIIRSGINGEDEFTELLVTIHPGTVDGTRIVLPAGQIPEDVIFVCRRLAEEPIVSKPTNDHQQHSPRKSLIERMGKVFRWLFEKSSAQPPDSYFKFQ